MPDSPWWKRTAERFCPDCSKIARLIETTEEETKEKGFDEYKEVLTCDHCDCLFYIIRRLD